MGTYIQPTTTASQGRDYFFKEKVLGAFPQLPAFNPCEDDAWGGMCDAEAACTFTSTPRAIKCDCEQPFVGEGTSGSCVDFRMCYFKPCFADQATNTEVDCFESVDASTGFYCGPCPPGYAGDGEICGDQNACMLRPCAVGVECHDHPAPSLGFTCGDCPPGYHGDGMSCSISPHSSHINRLSLPRVLYPGEPFTLEIEVENVGTSIWRTKDDYFIGSEQGMSESCVSQVTSLELYPISLTVIHCERRGLWH